MANSQINLNGNNMKIRDNGDTTFSTSIAKTNYYSQVYMNLTITDILNHFSSIIDVTMLENTSIFINNGLNQSVTLQVMIYDPTSTYYYTVATTKTISGSSAYLVSSVDIPVLNTPFTKVKFNLYCSVAPTSGSVNAWLIGH